MYDNINIAVGGPINADYPKVYKTKFLKPGIPVSLQVTEPNTKYVIKYNFDLDGGTVTVPANCVLEFDGGSLKNGTLVGQNTIFNGLHNSCLLTDFSGTFGNAEVNANYFGIYGTGKSNNNQINFEHLSHFIEGTVDIKVIFPTGVYGYGRISNLKQIQGPDRSFYNYRAIALGNTAVTKVLYIEGNNSTFIPSISFYVGLWDYNNGNPTISNTDSAAHWTYGGGFMVSKANLDICKIVDCIFDGELDNANYGNSQSATQEYSSITIQNSPQIFIENCVMKNNVTDGLCLGKPNILEITNSEFTRNMRWGFSTADADKIIIKNCKFFRNGYIYGLSSTYRFEGNHGDIDLEVVTNTPSRHLTISDCKFIDTGGVNSIVANRNIKSVNITNTEFSSSHVSFIKNGTTVDYDNRFTSILSFNSVVESVFIDNIRVHNMLFIPPTRGCIPLDTDMPAVGTDIFFTGDSRKYRSKIGNIKMTFSEDVDGMNLESSLSYEIFVLPSTYNYKYTNNAWTIKQYINEYNPSHFGDVDISNIEINLINNTCIGSNNMANRINTDSVIDNLTLNIKTYSRKQYIRNFKNTAAVGEHPGFILKNCTINDYREGDIRSGYIENIGCKRSGDGNIVLNVLGNGAESFRPMYDTKLMSFELSKGNSSSTTAYRPVYGIGIGYCHYDTTLNKPIWVKNVDTSTTPPTVTWVDATGATV